jgi:hypothetical protein
MSIRHDPNESPSATDVACPTLAQYNTMFPPYMMSILCEAIAEQTEIGWVNLLRGYFSTKWRDLASRNMANQDAPPTTQDGNCRAGTIIHRVQGYIQLMWKGRNEALHKCNTDDENKFLTLESAVIRHYFQQPHLLSVQDQHYCQGNILKILQGRPSHRRRWLMRVRRARAALLKDKLRQSRITSFFTRNINRATTAQTLPAEIQTPTIHTRQTRTQSQIPTLQQPRLYHFSQDAHQD